MFLSYAQRLEDHHLLAAFEGEGPGFYVDVGAGHPVADNATFALYERGWSGLAVEPQEGLLALYERVRPRDRRVGVLLGAEPGEAEFHAFAVLHGFSTTDGALARRLAGDDVVTVTRRPVTTLAVLLAAHEVARIDLLKVDVEGAEAAVLAGNDWSRWRPRVVVAEAVEPGTMAPSHAAFEPILLAQGYRHALFDGLNRFYVAPGEDALLARLPREPAPWDAARHLYEFGRAPERPDHPDHALAAALVRGLMAGLPLLPEGVVADLLARAGVAADPASEAVRAALGRIAAPYDGGLMLDD